MPLHIPGTTLEGGGQLLRLSICLSALTHTPIVISDIRANRSGGGGLKSQHLTGLMWLKEACGARVSGVGLRSRAVGFGCGFDVGEEKKGGKVKGKNGGNEERSDGDKGKEKGRGRSKRGKGGKAGWESVGEGAAARSWRDGGEVRIQQSTPGSVNLVFQAILPYILFSSPSTESSHQDPSSKSQPEPQVPEPIRVRITGGTNVSNSPSYDYVEQVLLPMLEKIGIPKIEARLESRGWSTGQTRLGSVMYTVTPLSPGQGLDPFTLMNRGAIIKLKATILAPREYEQAFRDEVEGWVDQHGENIFPGRGSNSIYHDNGTQGEDLEIVLEDSHHAKRFYILLVATSSTGIKLGRDWLYDRAVKPGTTSSIPATMVKKVFKDLFREIEHGGCVDEYMRDQIVVFQSLAMGRSEVFGGRKSAKGEGEGFLERGEGRSIDDGELVQPSLHARTAMWVAEQILGVEFDGEGGCQGVGFGVEMGNEKIGGDKEDGGNEKEGKNDGDDELVEGVEALKL